MTTFAETTKRIQGIINDAKKEAEKALLDEFKAVFERHPEIQVITWTQYTPYFMDGDTCEFTVHDVYVSDNIECSHWGEFEEEDEDKEVSSFVYQAYDLRTKAGWDDVYELLQFMETELGHDILEFSLGDHVLVRVTRDGIETRDYDHD